MDSKAAAISRALFRGITRVLQLALTIIVAIALITAYTVWQSGDPEYSYPAQANIVNDVTRLNPIHVAKVETPQTVEEIVHFVQNSSGPISIGGGRYSQGGQIGYPDSLHIDMREFDRVLSFEADRKLITVQPGITWRKIQEYIDPHDLSVKIMQTYANFSVGGSLSVNVHGRYIGEGPLVHSVEAIKVVLASGELVSASRAENSDIFFGAIGGYGGLGVIVEATLQLADNVKIERRVLSMKVAEYLEHFRANVRDNPQVVFHNGDIYPPDYDDVRDVSWYETDASVTIEERLIPTDREYFWGPFLAGIVASSDFAKWLRQHVMEPLYYSEDRVVWRNWEASYDVRELEPKSRSKYTYVLREYFVPVDAFDRFVPRMRDIFRKHDANILNVSIRHAKADPDTLLAWARREVFAFVVYYRQGTSQVERDAVRAWSLEMIDTVIDYGGTYYLPYQIFATPEQFLAAYPRSREWFALKERLDPDNRFTNRLWQQHYRPDLAPLRKEKASLGDYFRREEQTILTIPEWYLVFSPLDYADYLEAGQDPSTFPFFASIDEYWSLYDRATQITETEGYLPNDEYTTMLNVIGVSTSVEYVTKGLYENSMGRFTRWLADGEDTPEDEIISAAHRAYSDLIFDEPWYEFDFWSRVARSWSETRFFGPNFLRKLERKLFFTAEFGLKTLYAKLIKLAAESTYGESEEVIYLTARNGVSPIPSPPAGTTILNSEDDLHLMAVPRWGGFTETIPKLANAGFEFVDISGNRRIAVSLVTPTDAFEAPQYVSELFRSSFVSDDARERVVLFVDVKDLNQLTQDVDSPRVQLEHIYDY